MNADVWILGSMRDYNELIASDPENKNRVYAIGNDGVIILPNGCKYSVERLDGKEIHVTKLLYFARLIANVSYDVLTNKNLETVEITKPSSDVNNRNIHAEILENKQKKESFKDNDYDFEIAFELPYPETDQKNARFSDPSESEMSDDWEDVIVEPASQATQQPATVVTTTTSRQETAAPAASSVAKAPELQIVPAKPRIKSGNKLLKFMGDLFYRMTKSLNTKPERRPPPLGEVLAGAPNSGYVPDEEDRGVHVQDPNWVPPQASEDLAIQPAGEIKHKNVERAVALGVLGTGFVAGGLFLQDVVTRAISDYSTSAIISTVNTIFQSLL